MWFLKCEIKKYFQNSGFSFPVTHTMRLRDCPDHCSVLMITERGALARKCRHWKPLSARKRKHRFAEGEADYMSHTAKFHVHQSSRPFLHADYWGIFPHVPIAKQNLVSLDFKTKTKIAKPNTKIVRLYFKNIKVIIIRPILTGSAVHDRSAIIGQ